MSSYRKVVKSNHPSELELRRTFQQRRADSLQMMLADLDGRMIAHVRAIAEIKKRIDIINQILDSRKGRYGRLNLNEPNGS